MTEDGRDDVQTDEWRVPAYAGRQTESQSVTRKVAWCRQLYLDLMFPANRLKLLSRWRMSWKQNTGRRVNIMENNTSSPVKNEFQTT